MDIKPLIFSSLFFIAFAIYIFLGIYVINVDSKNPLNRIFLLVCISLGFWSFGFSMATSAPSAEICLLWRRVSAIGWGSIYSLLLHFFLLLTTDKCDKSRWIYCTLLHIPSVISVYAFAISTRIINTQFNLVRMDYGWVNLVVKNYWTLFFNSYYILYALVMLIVLWRWRFKSSEKSIHKQSNLIFLSVLSAFVLATATDVLLNSYFGGAIPQMAPLIVMIPVAAIYYSMMRYSMMRQKTEVADEQILDEKTREKLYLYLGISYIVGSILSFSAYLVPYILYNKVIRITTLIASILLFLIGHAILSFRFLKDEQLKNKLIITAVSFSIPVVTLSFMKNSSITVWAFPLVFIISFLVFNSKYPLIIITIVSIITQIVVAINAPKIAIYVDVYDHILRIVTFICTFFLGALVNNIYIEKLKENIAQTNFQKTISDISFDFVNINKDNIDEKIENMLSKVGNYFEVDNTFMFLMDDTDNFINFVYVWDSEKIKIKRNNIDKTSIDKFPWFMQEIKSQKVIFIKEIDDLQVKASSEKDFAVERGITSLAIVSLEENKNLLGVIGFSNRIVYEQWTDHHDKLLRIISNIVTDALIKVKAEKEIEFMAFYDHLTGLPNRLLFLDRLKQAINLAKRNARLVGVMYIDIDNFKMLNDSLGHTGGDMILNAVAQGLQNRLRKTDAVARFSGDEFLIMINDIGSTQNIVKVANNIMNLFKKPFDLYDQQFFITASGGLAAFPLDGEDPHELIKNADIALQKAKIRGKNQYVICTEDMRDEVRRNMILSNSLYRALDRGEFFLNYQPQVNLETSKIVGFEALLRWRHPEMGIISPGIFVPLAEQNGLIHSLGDWVLKTAARQNKRWQDMGFTRLRMAVNLSMLQFNDPHIIKNVENSLADSGLDPEYLELEITESIAAAEESFTIDVLNGLKDLGLSISIDDFGTEYSSLNRIKKLPIDRIKIDMQFVQGIEKSNKDKAITSVIINLAKNLNLEVLAEGVETRKQADFLIHNRCDDVQGYYYYKPMGVSEIEDILRAV